MQITRGKIITGERFVLYGPEGIGKSTFVSHIPGVVFIDTEGSTCNMDVPRLPTPSSWTMLLSEVDDAIRNAGSLQALVIDTADWAERLCIDHIIAEKQIKSIEDFGYGKGYVMVYEEFGKLLNKLSDLAGKGVHVGFTAHAMMRKFEQPDEMGAYDRWELKMSKKVAPMVKEWASIMLFANYKTFVYATDKDGKKYKASGGQRVMYTNHSPVWDAKNRHGLPDELPFEYSQVAAIFQPVGGVAAPQIQAQEELPIPPQIQQPGPDPVQPAPAAPESAPQQQQAAPQPPDIYFNVPAALADLMRQDGIHPDEVKAAIAQRGYFPLDTPWAKYPADFVQGVLIGAWPQVKQMCLDNREGGPF